MKIEIDLNDLFPGDDETPPESLAEAIRRQVSETLTRDLRKRLQDRLDRELGQQINTMIRDAMASKMDGLIGDILDAEYITVDRYGTRGERTTFRNEMIKAIHQEMKYAPKAYHNEENAFTKAVRSSVEEISKGFKTEFDAIVNKTFVAEAMNHATATLKKKLGIS